MLDTGDNLSKIYKIIILLTICFVAPGINNLRAQSLVDDISSPIVLGDSAELFTETIKIISRSQKIFILTNSNQMLNKGDFITIILNDVDPVARALVGKSHNGMAGIKILKVYSLKRWALMRTGLDVQILKGDDSRLFMKKEEKEKTDEAKIKGEEDLYSLESVVEEDIDFLEKDTRHIKPDNIVGAAWSRLTFENDLNTETQTESHDQIAFNWAFQFQDNYWAEAVYGRTLIDDFPAKGAQTLINNLTLRLKYTIKAPLYSYIMPYVGYQIYSVSSPDAGQGTDPIQNIEEEELIDELGQDGPAFGVTILRRLVPGWFLKGDLGNDILSIGVAIEF